MRQLFSIQVDTLNDLFILVRENSVTGPGGALGLPNSFEYTNWFYRTDVTDDKIVLQTNSRIKAAPSKRQINEAIKNALYNKIGEPNLSYS